MNEMNDRESTAQAEAGGRGSAVAKEFTVGGVLSRTFRAMNANPRLFCGLTLISLLPAFAVEMAIKSSTLSEWILAIPSMTFIQVMQGAMVYAVFRTEQKRSATIVASLTSGLRRFFALIAIAFLATFVITFVVALGALALTAVALWFPGGRAGVLISGILLFAAGIFIFIFIFSSIPAIVPSCVAEGLGPLASIRRGVALTGGSRWKISALCLLLSACLSLTMLVSNLFVVFLPFGWFVRRVVTNLILLLPLTFASIMWPVIYCNLRETKEGASVGDMANAFD